MRAVLTIIAVLTLALAAIVAQAQQPITIYYFDRPPLYYQDGNGRAAGRVVERARLAFQRAGVPHVFKMAPHKRILHIIKSGCFCCGIGWFKNVDRQAFANFSLPIYRDPPLVALANKTAAQKLPRPPTLKQLLESGLVFGVNAGYSYGPRVDGFIQSLQPPREVVTNSQMQLARMAAMGRVDYLLTNKDEARWMVGINRQLATHLTIVRIADEPPRNSRYIMYGRSVPSEVVERLNRAIIELGQPGR